MYSFPAWDRELFIYLNNLHTEWLDPIMLFLSSWQSFLLIFLLVSYFMLRRSRFWGSREILLIFITVAANSLVNNILKLFFQRPRPCHEEDLYPLIRMIEECGEHYSFFSAHSSNAFCLAICTASFFKNKYYSFLITVWAFVVAYSRIYVGKHYPLDVICGILFGILISYMGNYLLKTYREEKIDQNLNS